MACYHPLKGYQGNDGRWISGKKYINNLPEMSVPCGQCIGCRLERARQWSLRITHEASLWDDNSFITLTYNDKYLPLSYDKKTSYFKKSRFSKIYEKA